MKELKVRLTFTDKLLGTASADPEIYEKFIASNAPDAETRKQQIARIGVEEVAEKSMTIFPSNADGNPIVYAYQVKGFFKDACGALRKVKGSESEKIKAYKKEIDGLIFPAPDEIEIHFDGETGNCQRSLRAQTPQGDRTALASSETVPEGATIEFSIQLFSDSHEKVVREWLDYGKFRGLGQWRNSGKGRFEWEEI